MIVPYIQKSPHSIPKIVAIISRLTRIVYLIVSTALNFDGGLPAPYLICITATDVRSITRRRSPSATASPED